MSSFAVLFMGESGWPFICLNESSRVPPAGSPSSSPTASSLPAAGSRDGGCAACSAAATEPSESS